MTRTMPSPIRMSVAADIIRRRQARSVPTSPPGVTHTAAPAPTGAANTATTPVEALALIVHACHDAYGPVEARRLWALSGLRFSEHTDRLERAMPGIGAAR